MSLSSTQPKGKSTLSPDRRRRWRPPAPGHSSRVTIEGCLFFALASLIGLAAVNTGYNLLYLVFSVMLAMLGLSGVVARLNLRRLHPERRYPLRLYAGETHQAALILHNRKRFTGSYVLRLVEQASLHHEAASPVRLAALLPMVGAHARAEVPLPLHFPRRGLWRLGPIEINSRFPFGLVRHRLRIHLSDELLVYPARVPIRPPAAMISAAGEHQADRRGSGLNIFSIRDYQRGDPSRHIHWKHSAKGAGIKLKEFEEERSIGYRLVLDLRAPDPLPPGWADAFEEAVSITASLCELLLRRGLNVGLWTSQGHVPLGGGPRHRHRLLTALARLELNPGNAEAPALPPESGHVATCWLEFRPGRPVAQAPLGPLDRLLHISELQADPR